MALVAGVVEVGVAQTVAELVADSADAVESAGAVNLIAARVGVDGHAVEGNRLDFVGCRELPLVGPHHIGIFIVIVGLTMSGIENEHLVDFSVAIPVVL